ncbi:hypothetical protein HDU96_009105 [Phlyctochytrium bullatum]|nr:hypothetical protein HDU96_009105 [Phlyctochytrium bullatum]
MHQARCMRAPIRAYSIEAGERISNASRNPAIAQLRTPSNAPAPKELANPKRGSHEPFSNLFRNSKLASITYPSPSTQGLDALRPGSFNANTQIPSSSLPGYERLPNNVKTAVPSHVLTTTPELRAKGEWGLKRSLPRDLRTRHVIVTRLDHHMYGSRGVYRSANREVGDLERWRWLFGYNETVPELQKEAFAAQRAASGSATSEVEPVPLVLETLDSRSYVSLLRRAQLLRNEWVAGRSSRAMRELIWQRFLGINTAVSFNSSSSLTDSDAHRPVHPPFYLVSPVPRTAENKVNRTSLFDSFAALPSQPAINQKRGTDSLKAAVLGDKPMQNLSSASSTLNGVLMEALGQRGPYMDPFSKVSSEMPLIPTIAPVNAGPGGSPLPLLKPRVVVRYLNGYDDSHAVGVLGFVGRVSDKDCDPIELVSSDPSVDIPIQADVLEATTTAQGAPLIKLRIRAAKKSQAATKDMPTKRQGMDAFFYARTQASKKAPKNFAKKRTETAASPPTADLLRGVTTAKKAKNPTTGGGQQKVQKVDGSSNGESAIVGEKAAAEKGKTEE